MSIIQFGHMLSDFEERLAVLETALNNSLTMVTKDHMALATRVQEQSAAIIADIESVAKSHIEAISRQLEAIQDFRGEPGKRDMTPAELDEYINKYPRFNPEDRNI